jgi:hypothetical protein
LCAVLSAYYLKIEDAWMWQEKTNAPAICENISLTEWEMLRKHRAIWPSYSNRKTALTANNSLINMCRGGGFASMVAGAKMENFLFVPNRYSAYQNTQIRE